MSHSTVYHVRSHSASAQEGLISKNSRDTLDRLEKERDSLLWQARWQAYEQKKRAWLDSSWSEYQEQKETGIKSRWQEYNNLKTARWTEQEKKSKPSQTPTIASSISTPTGKDTKYNGFVHPTSGVTPPSTPLSTSSPAIHKSTTPIARTCTPVSVPLPKSTPSSPLRSSSSSTKYRPLYAPVSPIPSARASPHTRSSSLSGNQSWTQFKVHSSAMSSPPIIFKPKTSASDSDIPDKPNIALKDEERQRREIAQEHLRQYAIQEAAKRKAQASGQLPTYPKRRSKPHAAGPKPEAETAEDQKKKADAEKEAIRLEEASKAERIQRMREEQWKQDMKEYQERKLQRERLAASIDTRELERQNALRESFKAYEERWQALYDGKMAPGASLTFLDIPWPLVTSPSDPNGLEPELIKAFLLSSSHSSEKAGKLRVREAMLRFHPDRFEGRWISRVRESDRLAVKEGVGRVVRVLNETSARLAMA